MESMLDFAALSRCLDDLGLAHWRDELERVIGRRLHAGAHGDYENWQAAIEALMTSAQEIAQRSTASRSTRRHATAQTVAAPREPRLRSAGRARILAATPWTPRSRYDRSRQATPRR